MAVVFWLSALNARDAEAGMVVSWGDNSSGQTNVPSDLTNAIAVAGGEAFSIALRSDGTVTAWGDNSFGQTNVSADLSNVVAISAGYAHTLALKADGKVVAWGKDDFGQADVPLDLSNVVAIAAGRSHSLALRADGTVRARGDNSFGQTNVPLNLSNVVAIAAGGAHCIALRANGTVTAWGDNSSQQTNVPFGLNNVVAIAAGDSYCLALRGDGRVVAWGSQTNVPVSLTIPSAAIISANRGTTETSISKVAAQDGNVVINGYKSGPIVVDGGAGLAVEANGRVNVDTNYLNPPAWVYSMTNWGTAAEIPDYTAQGTSETLFDFNRLIAVADATPNGYAPSGNNHFTNIATFMAAATNHPPASPMQGVVVLDVWLSDRYLANFGSSYIPNGINVRGTLLFNCVGPGWDPFTKIVISTAVNINPADLSYLVATDPATYPSGYPPAYTDPSKNPININIAPAYQNFTASDDLPALAYTTGVVDLHGPLNLSGILYSPSYVEIENKYPSITQYIKGSVITGNGVYFENTTYLGSQSIISCGKAVAAWIAAGTGRNLTVNRDGTVFSWGDPISSPAGLSNVVAVAAGGAHNLALIGNGPPTIQAALTNSQFGTAGFTVSAPTRSGRVYALEYKTSLGDNGWTALPLVPGNSSLATFIDPAAGGSQRFYRLREW
jgi:hypothetical protein